tara:strand:+ start:59 stop:223 length:165 start_codon:yes stop_codon:yes gene_type:complete
MDPVRLRVQDVNALIAPSHMRYTASAWVRHDPFTRYQIYSRLKCERYGVYPIGE